MSEQEKALVDIVLSLENLDEATSALTELKYINASKTEELATNILIKKLGDSYLRANAFEVMYSINQIAAIQYILDEIELVDVNTLSSMLECVTEDSNYFEENQEHHGLIKKLYSRVNKLSSEEHEKINESLDWFKSSFINLLVDV